MKVLVALLALIGSGQVSFASAAWDNPPSNRIPGLEHRTFRSPSMKVKVGYNVCLPAEYADETRRFPVIYYLHGYEGNESSYLGYARYWRESMSAAGASILVFVNGGESSFFCDAPDGSIMGETVVRELIAEVDRTYRTLDSREGRSLHGYSMGGFGALKIAFKSPELIGSVVAYGPTLSNAEQMKKHLRKAYVKMFAGEKGRFDANDPLLLLRVNADAIRKNRRVLLVIGTKDEFLSITRELHNRLVALGVAVEWAEISGARHEKDPLYETAARRGFIFSGKAAAGH